MSTSNSVPPPDPTVPHVTSIEDTNGEIRATCICGWRSPALSDKVFAAAVRDRHEKHVKIT